MLSKISGFLFMPTVNRCFLLLFYDKLLKHTERQRFSQRSTNTPNTCTLTLFSAKHVSQNNCFETGH